MFQVARAAAVPVAAPVMLAAPVARSRLVWCRRSVAARGGGQEEQLLHVNGLWVTIGGDLRARRGVTGGATEGALLASFGEG